MGEHVTEVKSEVMTYPINSVVACGMHHSQHGYHLKALHPGNVLLMFLNMWEVTQVTYRSVTWPWAVTWPWDMICKFAVMYIILNFILSRISWTLPFKHSPISLWTGESINRTIPLPCVWVELLTRGRRVISRPPFMTFRCVSRFPAATHHGFCSLYAAQVSRNHVPW